MWVVEVTLWALVRVDEHESVRMTTTHLLRFRRSAIVTDAILLGGSRGCEDCVRMKKVDEVSTVKSEKNLRIFLPFAPDLKSCLPF